MPQIGKRRPGSRQTRLRNILNEAEGIEIAGEAANGEEAIRLNRKLKPDLILMDISLPGLSGFETTERILKSHPEVKIIVLNWMQRGRV